MHRAPSGHHGSGVTRALYAQLERFFAQRSCARLYLDIGANIGVQLRKLYEPHKYAQSPMLRVFDETFGTARRCEVCAVGFEPNPTHALRLEELQHRLLAAGASLLVIKAAVGAEDGMLRLGVGGSSRLLNDYGASVHARNASRWVRVPKLDLAEVLGLVRRMLRREHRSGRSSTQRTLMKLDIEGLEAEVLPRLLGSSNFSICTVDRAMVEWHERNSGLNLTYRQRLDIQRVHRASMALNRSWGCRIRMDAMDDETYILDGQPWPNHNQSVC